MQPDTAPQPLSPVELDPATLPTREVVDWSFVYVGGLVFDETVCEADEEQVAVNPNTGSFSVVRRDKQTRAILSATDYEAANRVCVRYIKRTETVYPEGYNPAAKHISEIAANLAKAEAEAEATKAAKANVKPITDDDF
jgi:hypothetical protein